MRIQLSDKLRLVLGFAVTAIGVLTITSTSASAAIQPLDYVPDFVTHKSSSTDDNYHNWSGYAVSANTYREVGATFTIPSISCTIPTAKSLFWVGFDGFQNATVEQTGVEAGCNNSPHPTPYYEAWWEMYPTLMSTEIMPIAVHGGDSITVSARYIASAQEPFQLSLNDTTDHQQYTKSMQCGKGLQCSRSSVEWIAERPSQEVDSYYPLAGWSNSVKFTNALAATTDQLEPISHFQSTHINMINSTGTHDLATATALSPRGNSFFVNWVESQ